MLGGRIAVLALGVITACQADSRHDLPLGAHGRFGIGTPATAQQIAVADVDVSPSGAGLPAGSGTPQQGAVIYSTVCASCHGANGEGHAPYPRLLGGSQNASIDFAANPAIPHSIGNYWPYATTVFDYIRRAMPPTAPGSLTDDQIYALTAFLLAREGLIRDTAKMNARTLPAVRMPARRRFVPDNRRATLGGKRVR